MSSVRSRWKRIREVHFSNFWDTLAWIAFAYAVIYALLKVTGVLNSPIPIDVAAIASVAYFVGKHVNRVDFMAKEIETLKAGHAKIEDKLVEHIGTPH